MRIKRLELTGFKSSKDRTVLEFPDGITGIVGPNGCGKSNIVDALRWVLGEQSARHLRGRSMEDVIFVGNQHYGPMGMAEVSIVLDNEDGMPEPGSESGENEEDNEVVRALRKVPELQVTRRLYRSGESEYLINDKPCRLRDITELFLGTGVGTKAYSIVEQGRVGQIIGAKPEELRLFIEEAAGTTLYRSRKIAAERKIERTRDNLLRVSDIVRELDRQANSLRRQARGAVQFQELRTQEDALDRAWTALRLRGVDTELRGAAEAAATQSGREHALRLEIARSHEQRETLRERGRETEAAREAAQQALYAARARMNETEQERRHLAERRAELEALLGESGNDLGRLDERLAALSGETAEAERRRDELAGRYEAARATCAELAGKVRACDDRYFTWSSEADSMRSRLIEALGASAALRNERAAVARQIEAASARETRLKSEDEALCTVKERLQEDLRIADAKLDELAHALDAAEGSKRDAAQALEAAQTRRAEAQTEAERWRDECALLRSRLESLEELHRGFSGYNDGVRAFMSNGGRERADARAVVADVIEIESGFEGAVAAVLGEALQYIVVPTTQSGIEGARYLREQSAGRATFLPLADAEGGVRRESDDSLSRHVRVREGFEQVVAALLDGCILVGDLEEARRRWESGERRTFVTTDGEVVNERGTVTGGSENPVDEGLLLRSSELRRIREQLEEALTSARVAQDALRATADAAAGMDGKLVELDRELHHLAVERVRWNGEKRLHDQNAARTEERLRAVRAELESVQREKAAARTREEESEASLRSTEEEAARLEGERATFEAAGKSLETERRQALSDLEQSRIAEAEARQRIESLASQLSALAIAKDEAAGRRDALLARVERSRLEIASVGAKLTDPVLDVEKLKAACAEAEEKARGVDVEAATAREASQRLDKDLDALSGRLDEARAEYSRCELRRKQFELERSTLLEGASERLGIGADELVATEIAEGSDAASLAADLEAVRGKIRRLGTVNLGAVAELEEIEKRLAELCGQRDDLERSIEDLRGTIARLNKLSRQRFEETFEEVNRIFQATFPKLFQGGKASLALTDPENLLETGVEIFAQPPGKRLGTLDLLSGGEKAMTAIGLIFALFLHRPSPFCVLDEVDAPLDEANIGRFARIVAEMCERSQFLVITHNKRTMEICDTLYGVTMPEPGVTRMVSVDLSQAA